jgi:hypothetical protein
MIQVNAAVFKQCGDLLEIAPSSIDSIGTVIVLVRSPRHNKLRLFYDFICIWARLRND